MIESAARLLVLVVQVYLAAGLVFALFFAARGTARLDPAAVGASWGFRLVILPAAAALWPYLARRWWRDEAPPPPADAHHHPGFAGSDR